MDVYEAFRRRSSEIILNNSADFQRIFGRNLSDYVCDTASGIIWLDWPRLFADIGVPLGETSVKCMRKKYGDEAVTLIGKLIF